MLQQGVVEATICGMGMHAYNQQTNNDESSSVCLAPYRRGLTDVRCLLQIYQSSWYYATPILAFGKVKDLYIAFIVTHPQNAQVWITQFYLQTTPYQPQSRKRSPDGAPLL